MTYAEIFETHVKRKPYAYQLRVVEALLEGKNVICRAPTGSGKPKRHLRHSLLLEKRNTQLFR